MTEKEKPYGVPNSGPPPHSVHNQSPLTPVLQVESEKSFTEVRPTSHITDLDSHAARGSPLLAQPSKSSSNDEITQTSEVSFTEDWPPVLTNVDFENALLEYGRRKRFMLSLFLLCTSPGILNGFHVVAYVFYGHTPKHWCSIPTLENANWTPEQIRNISSPKPEEWSNCEYYDLDYERLHQMGYEKAFEKVTTEKRPGTVRCGHFSYEIEQPGSSIVPEWNLVCNRLALKATVQTAVSFGKLLGAFVFGILADRYGRKVSFIIATFIYIVAGPVVALTSFYQVMVAFRICLGIAGLGVYQSAYSIVTEICPPELRSTLGVLYNQSYPLGILGIAAIGYYIRDWRKLQMCISVPAVFLLFHLWFLPESPRWLYYSGRKKNAWLTVGKYLPPDKEQILVVKQSRDTIIDRSNQHLITRLRALLTHYTQFLNVAEFRRRLIICWIVWCFTAMSYYSLSINANNLHMNPYIYVLLSGIVECVSYILALPLLRVYGRRSASSTLLLTGAGALLLLLIMPVNMTAFSLVAALLGRLCVSGVFCVTIVHACELFPTTIRNSAIGSSSTWAHIGSTFAPYLVDFFVIYGNWVPSTICGLALFVAALLVQTLPETRDLTLYNTLQDFIARCRINPRERVTYENCILYYLYKKCKGLCNYLSRSSV